MRCRKCETPNPPERTHCSKCGARLPPPPGKAAAAEAPRAKPRRPPEEEYDEVEVVEEVEEVKPRPRSRRETDEDDERPKKRRHREEDADEEPRRVRRHRREDDDEEDYDDEEDESTVAKVIPYHNAMALIGYYCAIFSLIPAVIYPLTLIGPLEARDALSFLSILLPAGGIVLGGAGLVLGIIGLVYARNNPRAKGGGHAATALFLSLLTFLICAVGWILYAMGVFPMKLIG